MIALPIALIAIGIAVPAVTATAPVEVYHEDLDCASPPNMLSFGRGDSCTPEPCNAGKEVVCAPAETGNYNKFIGTIFGAKTVFTKFDYTSTDCTGELNSVVSALAEGKCSVAGMYPNMSHTVSVGADRSVIIQNYFQSTTCQGVPNIMTFSSEQLQGKCIRGEAANSGSAKTMLWLKANSAQGVPDSSSSAQGTARVSAIGMFAAAILGMAL